MPASVKVHRPSQNIQIESGRVALNIFLENSLKECDTVLIKKTTAAVTLLVFPVFQMAGAVGQIVAAARRRREAADQARHFLTGCLGDLVE